MEVKISSKAFVAGIGQITQFDCSDAVKVEAIKAFVDVASNGSLDDTPHVNVMVDTSEIDVTGLLKPRPFPVGARL